MGAKNTKSKKKEPILAPGDKGILEKSASKEDLIKGNFTRVTNLSYNEVDPG
ncbi:MAG: hypothetical protein A4E53_02600 [Pelotomaculum sp. PtaB.Bin104]|nr:MAG: hypothetical protein A4E53_02600 [Pelotomaculum sp. PtaB.Bin104]